MGILYVKESSLAGQPVEETWLDAADAAAWGESRYYLGAAFTVLACLTACVAPALVASLAIVGLLR
jgi:hypothetical protein